MELADALLTEQVMNEVIATVIRSNAVEVTLEQKWFMECPNDVKVSFCSICKSYDIFGMGYNLELLKARVTVEYNLCSDCSKQIMIKQLQAEVLKNLAQRREESEEEFDEEVNEGIQNIIKKVRFKNRKEKDTKEKIQKK